MFNIETPPENQPPQRLDCPTYKTDGLEARAVRLGQEAWTRLGECQTWRDWIHVGRAHIIGRAEAMRAAGTNQPVGRSYNLEFAHWLKHHGFDALDKGDRSRLFQVMDDLASIENWLATIPRNVRLHLNHPSTVLRKWRAATLVVPPNVPKRPSAHAQLKAAHVEVLEKLHRAEDEIKRGGGDLWSPDDRADDIAQVMVAKLSAKKAEAVARAILHALKQRRT